MITQTVIVTNDEIDEIFSMISQNIKYYRLYNRSRCADENGKISQERLDELCNVSKSLISNIESLRVKQTYSITVIATISKVLEVPFEEFFKVHDFTRL